jgi:O-succinylbenzoic acid--CoA ligase
VADLIALALPPGAELVDQLRMAWDAGHAVLPVDLRLPDTGQRRLLRTMGAAAVVEPGGTHTPLDHGRYVAPGDALVVPTSGSTGEPKGVVLTHDAVAASARAGSEALRVDTAVDRWLACMPVCHMAGLGVVTKALLTGTPLEIHPRFDADAVMAAAAAGATLTTMVPTALRRIDPSGFRRIVVGGADVPDDLPDVCVTSYGLTETCGGLVYDGTPFAGCEVDVRDGEIFVRGPVLLRTYRDDTCPVGDDGWLATGDAGRITPDGRLVVEGRLSDLIITGGENVWPGPVEDVLRTHPAVAEVAVVGRPDPEWGQRVVAVVEIAAGHEEPSIESLRDHVRAQLPAFCAPKELEVVDHLPRTTAGKVRRASVQR